MRHSADLQRNARLPACPVPPIPANYQRPAHAVEALGGLGQRACSCQDPRVRNVPEPVVCRWLAAGDAGDLDAFDELLHVDAVIHAPAGLSTKGVVAEKAVWQDALAAMPDLCHAVQEVLVDGDVEMARVVVTGTMRASFGGVEGTGRSFRMDQAVITHLRDGKVAEAWEIADVASVRAQVSVETPSA